MLQSFCLSIDVRTGIFPEFRYVTPGINLIVVGKKLTYRV
jgi:hypothetical protein